MPMDYWWYRGILKNPNVADWIVYEDKNKNSFLENTPAESDIVHHINSLRGKFAHTTKRKEKIPLKFEWQESVKKLKSPRPKTSTDWFKLQHTILTEFLIFLDKVHQKIERN
jgi:hypothetical protein